MLKRGNGMSKSEKSVEELIYITDGVGNVICLPYSVENLHKMADDLGIAKRWYRDGHYKVPKEIADDLEEKCDKVTTTTLFRTVRNVYAGVV